MKYRKNGRKVHFQLKPGISLTIIPNKKFTTNQAVINFSRPQTRENSTSRNMLVSLLTTSSQKYPNQTVIARKLANMYGAVLDGYVARVGQNHMVRFVTSWLNSKWSNHSLNSEIFDFLYELIFHPLLSDGGFDSQSWQLQFENLMAAYKSAHDDKQYYAAQQLMRLYYADKSAMQVPSSGALEYLDTLTASSVLAEYRSMLENDQIDIVVFGDVDVDEIANKLKQWPLQGRHSLNRQSFYYHQDLYDQPLFKREEQAISQAKLNIAYSLPVYYRSQNYYTAVVMNSLLGGSAYSLMFDNIREKESLAYYASSSLRPFSGHLVLQTGINPATYQRVVQLIDDQIAALRSGMYSDERLLKVKNNLINLYLASSDNPAEQLEQALINKLLKMEHEGQVVEKIRKVGRQDITKLASHLTLQASYLLTGED